MDGQRSEHVGKLSWRMTALNCCTVTERPKVIIIIIIIIMLLFSSYYISSHSMTIESSLHCSMRRRNQRTQSKVGRLRSQDDMPRK